MVVEEPAEMICVENVSMVLPDIGTTRRTMFLTSCDLVCRSYPYINRLFFFKSSHGFSAYEAMVRLMQKGLARVLVHFYPLAGRLCNDADGRLQIDCDDEGVEFVEASCELPFSLLLHDGFQHRSLFWKLARRTHLLRCDYPLEPILSVQITKFADGGGFTVGVSMSHAVADAQSFYDFMNCWGETCRGVALAVPPKHMRSVLSVEALCTEEDTPYVKFQFIKNGEANGYFKSPNQQYDEVDDPKLQKGETVVDGLVKELREMGFVGKPGVRLAGQNGKPPSRLHAPVMEKQMEKEDHRVPSSDLVQKIFSFSTQKLQKLKDKVNVGTPANGFKKYPNGATKECSRDMETAQHTFTTFEAFCAHWWQCLISARRLPPTQSVFLLVPINCRQRFLDLPKSYFGNALDGGLVRLTAGELCEAEPRVIAGKIHEAIRAATEESFVQYIREAEKRRNAIPHFDRTGLFHIVDSPKYPVYDVNFGFGSPEAVRAEGFRFGAEVQILAGRLGPGSYDLFCALEPDTMDRLEHNPAFLACSDVPVPHH